MYLTCKSCKYVPIELILLASPLAQLGCVFGIASIPSNTLRKHPTLSQTINTLGLPNFRAIIISHSDLELIQTPHVAIEGGTEDVRRLRAVSVRHSSGHH